MSTRTVSAALVEVGAERLDGMRCELDERWLTGRHVVRAELLPAQCGSHDQHKGQDHPPAPREGHYGSHSAIMAASTCGNNATSTTMAVESARIASDPRFRVEH